MMDEKTLLQALSQTLSKHKVEKLSALAAKDEINLGMLIRLSSYPQAAIAFRATWILEHVMECYPHRFLQDIDTFFEAYLRQSNLSCQRHFTKILMKCCSEDKLIKEDKLAEQLMETTFQWLIDAKTPVAVKANCMDILFAFSKRYDWIKEELAAQIRFLLKDGGAAIQARGKRVLEKLEQPRN